MIIKNPNIMRIEKLINVDADYDKGTVRLKFEAHHNNDKYEADLEFWANSYDIELWTEDDDFYYDSYERMVRQRPNKGDIKFNLIPQRDNTLIKFTKIHSEPEELTIEEIEDRLGYKIKVVGGK